MLGDYWLGDYRTPLNHAGRLLDVVVDVGSLYFPPLPRPPSIKRKKIDPKYKIDIQNRK
jgi:hypothetical protein